MLSNDRDLGVSDQPSKVQKAAGVRPLYITLALLVVLLIATLVLAASNQDKVDGLKTTSSSVRTTSSSNPSSLETAIVLEEVFDHLRQF